MKQETDYVRHSIQAKSSASNFTTAAAALKQLSVSPIGVSFHNHDNLSISYRHIFHHPRSICLESFGLPPSPVAPPPLSPHYKQTNEKKLLKYCVTHGRNNHEQINIAFICCLLRYFSKHTLFRDEIEC